jgi:rubrerythrin
MSENATNKAGLVTPVANRRLFMGGVGLGLASLAMVTGSALPAMAQATPELTDADILNFALNLEYLEAEFYQRAAFGRGIPSEETGGQGQFGRVTGGRQVPFETDAIRQYAEEIANDEFKHVRFLRSALGSAAVARPAIDLDTSFTTAARAAGLVGPNQTFDPYANENNFLLAAFIFEDVGVTAYKGAARLISNPDILEAAAGILAVEAYHSGIIRTTLFQRGLSEQANAIADARDSLDGPEDKDQGIREGANGPANLVPADVNGLAFSRTPQEVLNIVYLGGEAADFGFFPDRINGALA